MFKLICNSTLVEGLEYVKVSHLGRNSSRLLLTFFSFGMRYFVVERSVYWNKYIPGLDKFVMIHQ